MRSSPRLLKSDERWRGWVITNSARNIHTTTSAVQGSGPFHGRLAANLWPLGNSGQKCLLAGSRAHLEGRNAGTRSCVGAAARCGRPEWDTVRPKTPPRMSKTPSPGRRGRTVGDCSSAAFPDGRFRPDRGAASAHRGPKRPAPATYPQSRRPSAPALRGREVGRAAWQTRPAGGCGFARRAAPGRPQPVGPARPRDGCSAGLEQGLGELRAVRRSLAEQFWLKVAA